ncbi:helix-turn-helix domain-containing protein [Lachnospiraceae bacterium 45-P1]
MVQRAKILLLKAEGRSIDSIAEELGINRRTVLLWTQKYRNRSADDTLG